MEKLIKIANGYMDEFFKNGRIENFLNYRNIMHLYENIKVQEHLDQQENTFEL